MGSLWEQTRETSGKVKVMLLLAREHHSQGGRESREASDGRLWAQSFLAYILELLFICFFIILMAIGGRSGVCGHLGGLLALFLTSIFVDSCTVFGSGRGKRQAPAVSHILQILVQSRHAATPEGGVANISRLRPCRWPLQLVADWQD